MSDEKVRGRLHFLMDGRHSDTKRGTRLGFYLNLEEEGELKATIEKLLIPTAQKAKVDRGLISEDPEINRSIKSNDPNVEIHEVEVKFRIALNKPAEKQP